MKVRVSDHQDISPTGKSVKGNLLALVRECTLFCDREVAWEKDTW